jgi:NDP-sugar pyrophosphorylase family protein
MKGAILAGGRGTRLHPYTIVIPKPLLPVGGVPVIEIIARQFKYFGFDQVNVSLGYEGRQIEHLLEAHSSDSRLPKFHFFHEDEPLGTSGAIPALFGPYDSNLLVMNGDIITSLDLREMYKSHCESNAILTIAIRKTRHRLPVGSIEVDSEGDVIQFIEKPELEFLDNVGIYVYSREVCNYIAPGEKVDVDILVKRLLSEKKKVSTFLSEGPYYWIDIGTHADYEKANTEISTLLNQIPFMK